MFIVIDGIDASGKSTQVELLSWELTRLWKTVKVLDFPRYDQESSYFVRKYLNGDYGKNVSAEMSSLFFALDRFDANYDFRDDMEKYDYIIANRYVSSSMIHHGCKIDDITQRGIFLKRLQNLEYKICGIPQPDKILFLSMSFENNQKLLQKRAYESGTTELDLHERDTKYMRKAWQTAHDISAQQWWILIDCEENGELLDRESITEKILRCITHP